MRADHRVLGLCLALTLAAGTGWAAAGSSEGREEPRVELWTTTPAPRAGEAFAVEVELAAPGSGRHGLGIAVAWESRRLEFLGFGDVFAPGLVAFDAEPEADRDDLDGDPRTDRLARLAWAEARGEWEGAAAGTRLAEVWFRLRDEDEAGRAGPAVVTAASLSRIAGYRFATARLRVGASSPREEGVRRRLEARERPEAVRSSARPNVVRTVSSRTTYRGAPEIARQASPTSPAQCSLDVDADGQVDALTDGLLILRYLFGFRGETLTAGAVGPAAGRTTGEAVEAFLETSSCLAMMDADGDGGIDALTDGLLVLRHLFGFSGETLAAGAVAPGAPRSTGEAVTAWLGFYHNLYAAIELSAPRLEAPLLSGIPATLPIPTRYTGTLLVRYALEEGSPGMEVDEWGGSLTWTPEAEDEGAELLVRVVATDTEATAEVSFLLTVATTTPVQTQVVGQTVTVIEPGSLQGLSITLPEASGGAAIEGIRLQTTDPTEIEIAVLPEDQAPPVPPWITRLSAFFRIGGWSEHTDPAKVELPLFALPQGRFLDEVELFISAEFDDGLGRPSWFSTNQDFELTAEGALVFDLWSAPGLCFIGLQGHPSEGDDGPGAAGMFLPDNGFWTQTDVTCEPMEILFGGEVFYRWSDRYVCRVAELELTVEVHGFDPTRIRWGGGPPTLEGLVGWLADSYRAFIELELDADQALTVKLQPMECDSGGCVLGFVARSEDYRTLHLASTWWEDRETHIELHPERFSLQMMQATAAHEYFHQAQARTRVPPGLNIMGYQNRHWISEGTAVWFEDEVFDHLDSYSGRRPGPRILEAGLASRQSNLGEPGDPYARFAFWKMLLSGVEPRCPDFELRQLFNFGLLSNPLANLESLLGTWKCDFGPGFGPDRAGTLPSALLRYNLATQFWNRLDFLDADETQSRFFRRANVYAPGLAASVRALGRERGLRRAGAASFLLRQADEGYLLSTTMRSGSAWVSVVSRDGVPPQTSGWAEPSSAPIVGSEPHYHTWAELTGTKTLRIDAVGGQTPELFITVVNPSTFADVVFSITVDALPDPGDGETGSLYATDPVVGNLRFVPAGTFVQGSPEDEACRDAWPDVNREAQFSHTLTKNLAVMETEVTRQMWANLKAAQPSLPNDPTDTSRGSGMSNPVQYVTWHQAVLFANLLSVQQGLTRAYYTDAALTMPLATAASANVYVDWDANGYRLPTEGEWEYFARAGTTGPFSVNEPNYNSETCLILSCTAGALPQLESAAWFCANQFDPAGNNTSKPVGLKASNPWGLKDVHGNVWEWVWDRHGSNPGGSRTDYRGPASGARRVVRGGGWDDIARGLRSASRRNFWPTDRFYNLGFRLVRSVN